MSVVLISIVLPLVEGVVVGLLLLLFSVGVFVYINDVVTAVVFKLVAVIDAKRSIFTILR